MWEDRNWGLPLWDTKDSHFAFERCKSRICLTSTELFLWLLVLFKMDPQALNLENNNCFTKTPGGSSWTLLRPWPIPSRSVTVDPRNCCKWHHQAEKEGGRAFSHLSSRVRMPTNGLLGDYSYVSQLSCGPKKSIDGWTVKPALWLSICSGTCLVVPAISTNKLDWMLGSWSMAQCSTIAMNMTPEIQWSLMTDTDSVGASNTIDSLYKVSKREHCITKKLHKKCILQVSSYLKVKDSYICKN